MSKLSRNKKPAKPQLNSSSDDFRDDPPKPKVAAVASAATTKENEDDSLSAAEGPEQLADCPFCGGDPASATACPTGASTSVAADWTGLDKMRQWAGKTDTQPRASA